MGGEPKKTSLPIVVVDGCGRVVVEEFGDEGEVVVRSGVNMGGAMTIKCLGGGTNNYRTSTVLIDRIDA
jgi:hypothetical protein